MTNIDARKLACPAPVLMTKEAIGNNRADTVRVLVDNEASMQNVSRFLESQAYSVSVDAQGDDFQLTGSREGSVSPEVDRENAEPAAERKIMVMIGTDKMGSGDDALGLKLMINFLKTLNEMGADLWRLVFVNNGVKLTVIDSQVLDVLQKLASEGVHIMVCGTCLTHFNLMDQKRVGETTNMLDIVTAMQLADKVVNL